MNCISGHSGPLGNNWVTIGLCQWEHWQEMGGGAGEERSGIVFHRQQSCLQPQA